MHIKNFFNRPYLCQITNLNLSDFSLLTIIRQQIHLRNKFSCRYRPYTPYSMSHSFCEIPFVPKQLIRSYNFNFETSNERISLKFLYSLSIVRYERCTELPFIILTENARRLGTSQDFFVKLLSVILINNCHKNITEMNQTNKQSVLIL